MEITLNLIEQEEPSDPNQYGNYLCLVDDDGEKKTIMLNWGMRGWFEKGVGCYGDDGEEVIAHLYLDDINIRQLCITRHHNKMNHINNK